LRPTYSSTACLRAGILTLGLLFAACGGETPEVTSDEDNPATADDDDGPKKDGGVIECTNEGKSSACKCASGKTGTHKCTDGKFSVCACGGTGTTDGGKPMVANKCKAGYYTGNFKGKYRPGAFGFGIFGSGFEVDIEGGKSFFDDTLPPLAFSLSQELSGSGEFQTFKVGGGCMQGLATAVVVTQSPFVAKLDGELNCSTGVFEGTLTGYYTLIGIPGADFSFKGPLTAEFNFEAATLDNGEWMVEEPPAANGDPAGGGEGTWDAMWTQDTAPMLSAKNPCDEIGPNGEHTPVTGTPAPTADAGVTTTDAAAP
jgi:hypothetical protein